MKRRSGKTRGLIASASVLGVCSGAFADTATSSLDVTATVVNSCTVDAANLAFGNYDPISASATTASTAVQVTCTSGAAYTVGLGNGAGTGADATAGPSGRLMTRNAGSDTLGYNLYQDAGLTTLWATGASAVSASGSGSQQSHTVYGRIPAVQAVPAGSYSDTVTITVTY